MEFGSPSQLLSLAIRRPATVQGLTLGQLLNGCSVLVVEWTFDVQGLAFLAGLARVTLLVVGLLLSTDTI